MRAGGALERASRIGADGRGILDVAGAADVVRRRAVGAGALLRRNLLLYGVTGLIVPFVGIKLIDLALVLFGLA